MTETKRTKDCFSDDIKDKNKETYIKESSFPTEVLKEKPNKSHQICIIPPHVRKTINGITRKTLEGPRHQTVDSN